MAKNNRTTLTFEYEGTKYTLGFSADVLKRMDRSGFSFSRLEDHVLTAQEDLFRWSFALNHSSLSQRKRDEIYKALDNKEELFDALWTMVSEAIEELQPKGNVVWTVEKN